MSVALAARFARRELRGGVKGFRIFLACLALGVAAIAGIGSVRSGIEAGLKAEGAALLGGDAEMQFTYRFATAEERSWMAGTAAQLSEVADFRSMAVVGTGDTAERGLTQVKAVDDLYPLVGAVTLAPEMPLAAALDGADGLPGAVMHPLLMDRLALEIGQVFKLGTQDFRVMAALIHEPDGAGSGFALGPRTIVRTVDLANSGLLAQGTLFTTKYRLDLPPEAALEATRLEADARFESSGMRWLDSRDGAPGIARFVERLGAFLVLVGLAGLAVGGVGVSSAVQSYLAGKTQVIATLRTLGADRNTIFLTYFIQIALLSLVGIGIGLVMGAVIPVLLAPLLAANLPVPTVIAVYPLPLVEAALYGALTAMIFTLWPLARAENVRAATLFRDALGSAKMLPAARYVVATAILVGTLIVAAATFSGSWLLTLWTAGGIAAAMLLLVVASFGVRRLARFMSGRAAQGAAKMGLGCGGQPARKCAFGGACAGVGPVGFGGHWPD